MLALTVTRIKQALPLLREGTRCFHEKIPCTAEMDHSLSNHLTGVAIIGILLVLPFCLSFGHTPTADAPRVSFYGFALPAMCMSEKLFGVHCPGCGMTRSFVAFAHGNWREAFRQHRLGPLVYLYLLALFVLHAYGAVTNRRALPRPLVHAHHWGGMAVVILLLLNWILG